MKQYIFIAILPILLNCSGKNLSGSVAQGSAPGSVKAQTSGVGAPVTKATESVNESNPVGSSDAEIASPEQMASNPIVMQPVHAGQPAMPAPGPAAPAPMMPAPSPRPSMPAIEEPVPEAVPPAIIAGAYLNCLPAAVGVNCDTRGENGALRDFGISKAYVIRVSDLIWTETTFRTTGTGLYHVDIPANLSGPYAIGMSTAAKENVADWVIMPETSLVQDGSFEAKGGTVPAGSVIEETTSDTWAWKAAQPGTGCTKAYIEIVMEDFKAASDGSHFLDTNTSCDGVSGKSSNPVVIYQKVKTKQGNLYQWMYDVRKNENADSNTLITRVNSVALTPYYVDWSNTAWMTHQNLIRATHKDGTQLEFQDGGPDPWGFGPLIDNVRVYDLGAGPK